MNHTCSSLHACKYVNPKVLKPPAWCIPDPISLVDQCCGAAFDRYHDHALHITLDNAYHGLAGMFVMSDKIKNGGCGEPYNLEVRGLGSAHFPLLKSNECLSAAHRKVSRIVGLCCMITHCPCQYTDHLRSMMLWG